MSLHLPNGSLKTRPLADDITTAPSGPVYNQPNIWLFHCTAVATGRLGGGGGGGCRGRDMPTPASSFSSLYINMFGNPPVKVQVKKLQ